MCIISPALLLSLKQQDTHSLNFRGAQWRKELCCQVVKERSMLCSSGRSALDITSGLLSTGIFCMHIQEEVCFFLPCSHPMITILTLGPVKASEQKAEQEKFLLNSSGKIWQKKMYFVWQSTFGTFYYNMDSNVRWILLYSFCSLTWTNLEKHKWVILSDNYSQRRLWTSWRYILSLGHHPQILLWSVKQHLHRELMILLFNDELF